LKTFCAIQVFAAKGDAWAARMIYKACAVLRPDGVSGKMQAHLCHARP
jgi:hypothetical protein